MNAPRRLVCACILFSFAMSALLSREVFHRLPHLEDELAYLFQARILARGQLTVVTPQPRIAFWQPFVIDRDGRRFGKYPLGYPALLALGEAAGAGWMVNALCGALSVALVYAIGRRAYGETTGAAAALLLAFSPMALLLNATLMSHTPALCCALLFIWGMERGALGTRRSALTTVLAALGLGMLIAIRPLAAVGIALPYSALSALALLRAGRGGWRALGGTARRLAVIALCALAFAATLPLFSAAATGSPWTNLYTLVWSYDRIGFGDCCGRSGHTLARALAHARFDLSLLAADLHGLQLGSVDAPLVEHLLSSDGLFPNVGLSLLLPALGLVVACTRRRRLAAWTLGAGLWVSLPLLVPGPFTTPVGAWVWLLIALAGVLAWAASQGAARTTDRLDLHWQQAALHAAVALSLILVHMAYWIGAQRYGPRYTFEALGMLCLLSALPLAWLLERVRRPWAWGVLVGVCVCTLVSYSLPRINALRGFNGVDRAWLDEARRRGGEGPLLVIVTGTDLSWRAMGTFMAVTGPYLDTPVVAVYNRVAAPGEMGLRDAIIAQFPDRVVIDLQAQGTEAEFVPSPPEDQDSG